MIVQGSQRADGSFRPNIKVKPGYIPQDEVPKYKNPVIRKNEQNDQKVNDFYYKETTTNDQKNYSEQIIIQYKFNHMQQKLNWYDEKKTNLNVLFSLYETMESDNKNKNAQNLYWRNNNKQYEKKIEYETKVDNDRKQENYNNQQQFKQQKTIEYDSSSTSKSKHYIYQVKEVQSQKEEIDEIKENRIEKQNTQLNDNSGKPPGLAPELWNVQIEKKKRIRKKKGSISEENQLENNFVKLKI